MCVFVYCVYACVCVYPYAPVWGWVQRLTLGIFFYCCLPYFIETDCPTEPETRFHYPTSLWYPHVTASRLWYTSTGHHTWLNFCLCTVGAGTGDWTWVLMLACAVITLLTWVTTSVPLSKSLVTILFLLINSGYECLFLWQCPNTSIVSGFLYINRVNPLCSLYSLSNSHLRISWTPECLCSRAVFDKWIWLFIQCSVLRFSS